MSCFTCRNRINVAGTCHIGCADFVDAVIKIGAGGDERYAVAKGTMEAMKRDGLKVAVRCIWPSSGLFPVDFDGGTVYACANHVEGEPNPETQYDLFTLMEMLVKHGLVPIMGELKPLTKKAESM